MKGQDILILLKLVSYQQLSAKESDPEQFLVKHCTARALASVLGVSKSEINASINRSLEANLAFKHRIYGYSIANRKNLLEFIQHGIKYVFPVKPGALARGIPTGFDVPQLRDDLVSAGKLLMVWPDVDGEVKGQRIEPLFKSASFAAGNDKNLYTLLALVDAIRVGNPREMKLAQQLFKIRLNA